MQAPASITTAIACLGMTGIFAKIGWKVRGAFNWKGVALTFSVCALFLLACAAQYLGYALNAPWTVFAIKLCAGISSVTMLALGKNSNKIAKTIIELSHSATYDDLTGLKNRRSGAKMLAELAQKTDQEFCLLLVDVDHFKRINDQYGHKRGDQVLEALAPVIKAQCRRGDVVSRWGGEEFLVILPCCEFKDGLRVAQSINLAVRQQGNCTVSIGVTNLLPQSNLNQALKRADDAMYTAKKGGRDRVCSQAQNSP